MVRHISVALAFGLVALFANAQQQQYLQGLTSSVNIDDKQYGQQLGKAGYNIPGGQNFWSLQQWGNTSNLMPRSFAVGAAWEISNANSRIKYYPQLNGKLNVYELAAANIPCNAGGNVTEANELDIFLQPDRMPDAQSTLGAMGELNLRINSAITYNNLQQGCSYNASSVLASIFLSTTNVTPQQAMAVQINLGGTQPPSVQPGWCPDYEKVTNPSYENIFCVDDSVLNYGGAYMSSVGGENYSLDILPRLIEIIQSGHQKPFPHNNVVLHGNPNNWYISGFYFGIANYGHANITTTWSDPALDSNGGAFCSGNAKIQYVCGMPAADGGWVGVGNSCHHRQSNVPC